MNVQVDREPEPVAWVHTSSGVCTIYSWEMAMDAVQRTPDRVEINVTKLELEQLYDDPNITDNFTRTFIHSHKRV